MTVEAKIDELQGAMNRGRPLLGLGLGDRRTMNEAEFFVTALPIIFLAKGSREEEVKEEETSEQEQALVERFCGNQDQEQISLIEKVDGEWNKFPAFRCRSVFCPAPKRMEAGHGPWVRYCPFASCKAASKCQGLEPVVSEKVL